MARSSPRETSEDEASWAENGMIPNEEPRILVVISGCLTSGMSHSVHNFEHAPGRVFSTVDNFVLGLNAVARGCEVGVWRRGGIWLRTGALRSGSRKV